MIDEDQYKYLDKSDLADIIFSLRKGVLAVEDLIKESGGVYDHTIRGSTTPWEDLLQGGCYEDWLLDLSKAIEVAHEHE